ncbi:hypothetical protein EB796_004846 [Bugula neritina]|uniref:Uncharacterized protein n=1 Tax=Bugula neritina TaxID=10212 RepID=A0A7J7KDW8_BUGNE|nr:hypothetical protein EB796_004846 [Bugula neritina]
MPFIRKNLPQRCLWELITPYMVKQGTLQIWWIFSCRRDHCRIWIFNISFSSVPICLCTQYWKHTQLECLSTKLLTIKYLYYWPIVEVTKSAKKAVTRVVRELSSQGHKVVEWELPQFDCIPGKLLCSIFFADGGTSISQLLIKGSTGLPLSVQCVALPYGEEMCLGVINLISKLQ